MNIQLDYSGKPINIHAPALGIFPPIDLVLKYNKEDFVFDIYLKGSNKMGDASALQVLNNIEQGFYIIQQ
jgi:hypothetical protein